MQLQAVVAASLSSKGAGSFRSGSLLHTADITASTADGEVVGNSSNYNVEENASNRERISADERPESRGSFCATRLDRRAHRSLDDIPIPERYSSKPRSYRHSVALRRDGHSQQFRTRT